MFSLGRESRYANESKRFLHHSDDGCITVETVEICLCFTHGNIRDNVMKCIKIC
jgi:hypothetical protein